MSKYELSQCVKYVEILYTSSENNNKEIMIHLTEMCETITMKFKMQKK
mgnify:CR=1 FL=1